MTWPTGTEHSRPGTLPNGGGLATLDLMIMIASIIVCLLLIFLSTKLSLVSVLSMIATGMKMCVRANNMRKWRSSIQVD